MQKQFMKFITTKSIYRFVAGAVVITAVTGFALVSSKSVEKSAMLASVPAFSLAVNDVTPADHVAAAEALFADRDREVFSVDVTVTGYSSTPGQTDSTPFITASNTRVREGIIAVSRDLLTRFTKGAPFSYGDVVELKGIGSFRVEDTMNKRYTKRVDIWFPNRRAARSWGVQKSTLIKLLENSAGKRTETAFNNGTSYKTGRRTAE